MKLLLIDDYVIGYRQLINARKDDVDYLLFNSSSDTYNGIFECIQAKNTNYSDIAFIQHGYDVEAPIEILCQENKLNPHEESFESFNDFKEFLLKLKSAVGVERFDMLACSLFVGDRIKKAFDYLEAETGIDLRASSNFTGNAEQGGDWVMESDNVDIRENYFTDTISNFKEILYEYAGGSMYGKNKLVKDWDGNVIYFHRKPDENGPGAPINPAYDTSGNQIKFPPCSVDVWGNVNTGGSNSDGNGYTKKPDNLTNVVAVYSNLGAFAALRANGTVACWGGIEYGGARTDGTSSDGTYSWSAIPANLNGVKHIYSTERAFAALKYNGSVVVWGRHDYGGQNIPGEYGTSSGFPYAYKGKPELTANIDSIYSNERAFGALTTNGGLYIWGYISYGGNRTDYSNVKSVYTNKYAFAFISNDRTLNVTGGQTNGGSLFFYDLEIDTTYCKCIYSTERAFAALKYDGTVFCWGNRSYGGMMVSSVFTSFTILPSDLRNAANANVMEIHSTNSAFLALKQNRKDFEVWGDVTAGGSETRGNPNNTYTYNNISINYTPQNYTNANDFILSICSNETVFGFIIGTVENSKYVYKLINLVMFGRFAHGGGMQGSLLINVPTGLLSNPVNPLIKSIYSTTQSMAALTDSNIFYYSYDMGGFTVDASLNINNTFTNNNEYSVIKQGGTIGLFPITYYVIPITKYFINVSSSSQSFAGLRLPIYTSIISGTSLKTPTGTKLVENLVVGDVLSTPTSTTKVTAIYSFQINEDIYNITSNIFPNQNGSMKILPTALISIKKGIYSQINSLSQYNSYKTTENNTYYCIVCSSLYTKLVYANNIGIISYDGTGSIKYDNLLSNYIEKQKYITYIK